MMYIDSHSHLYLEQFSEDVEETVQRALDAKVNKIILPDISSETREVMLQLADEHKGILFPLLGLHPCNVDFDYKKELGLFEKELAKHTFYGIGECGIDLYWDKTYYAEQVKVFEYQLDMAKDMNLPVVIHSRKSMSVVIDILKKRPYVGGIVHCFPGDKNDAKRLIDMGYYLGIGGVVTFKNSGLVDVIKEVGIQKLVLETDAPYLAPVPYRGKRNESAFIPNIAQFIADFMSIDVEVVAKVTSENSTNVFNLS